MEPSEVMKDMVGITWKNAVVSMKLNSEEAVSSIIHFPSIKDPEWRRWAWAHVTQTADISSLAEISQSPVLGSQSPNALSKKAT